MEAGAHRKNKHNSLKFYNGLGRHLCMRAEYSSSKAVVWCHAHRKKQAQLALRFYTALGHLRMRTLLLLLLLTTVLLLLMRRLARTARTSTTSTALKLYLSVVEVAATP